MLVWAREHGCPWDGLTRGVAEEAFRLRDPKAAEILEYVRANSCPHPFLDDSDSDPALEDDY